MLVPLPARADKPTRRRGPPRGPTARGSAARDAAATGVAGAAAYGIWDNARSARPARARCPQRPEGVDPRRVAVRPGRLQRVAAHQRQVGHAGLRLAQLLRAPAGHRPRLVPLPAAPGTRADEAQLPPRVIAL